MSVIDDLLENNRRFAAAFERAERPASPARKLAVVACMDARVDPVLVLGLRAGDAHVIRNAGGVVTDDVIRSLAISQHILGTEEIMLLHHTRCGMQTLSDEDFAAALEQASGRRPAWRAGAFSDLEEDVRDSLRRVRECPFLACTESVRGFVYEIETGVVREVR